MWLKLPFARQILLPTKIFLLLVFSIKNFTNSVAMLFWHFFFEITLNYALAVAELYKFRIGDCVGCVGWSKMEIFHRNPQPPSNIYLSTSAAITPTSPLWCNLACLRQFYKHERKIRDYLKTQLHCHCTQMK